MIKKNTVWIKTILAKISLEIQIILKQLEQEKHSKHKRKNLKLLVLTLEQQQYGSMYELAQMINERSAKISLWNGRNRFTCFNSAQNQ